MKVTCPIVDGSLFFSHENLVLVGKYFCANLSVIIANRSEYPQLSSQGSLGSKNVPVKGSSPGPLTRQKSVSGKLTERSPSSLPSPSQSLLKLKKDAMTKHSGMINCSMLQHFNIVNSTSLAVV